MNKPISALNDDKPIERIARRRLSRGGAADFRP
jgi:hypothetical protein